MAAEGSLSIDVSREGDKVVLRLDGELDLASVSLLESEVENAAADGTATIVLDLRKLEFIDSTGLRTILSLDQRCTERGQTFALVRGSQQVQRLMNMTRVDEHLKIIATPEEILL
jgi:anti-sigma B factor antagonist